jgi:hypothetical protein
VAVSGVLALLKIPKNPLLPSGTAGEAAGPGTGAVGSTTPAAGGSGFLRKNEKSASNIPPDCFLVPLLALRLLLRATLDLYLVMIIVNNYILNEDINI